MEELIKAVVAKYNSAAGADLRAATPGGIWISQAPESASGAYIVVTPVTGPISFIMASSNNPHTQDCDVQFTISTLAGSAGDIATAMSKLRSLYDFCSMTMTGKTLLVARRLNEQGPMRDEFSNGYYSITEFRFMLGG